MMEVSVHNKREEEALFPVLERYVEGPTQLMRDEHKILRREFRKLRTTVTRLEMITKNAAAATRVWHASRKAWCTCS